LNAGSHPTRRRRKIPRLTSVGFLLLVGTVSLANIHQAVAQVPGSTPVRSIDPVDPFQTSVPTPFGMNAGSTGEVVVINVPDKKRLVIEYVSGFAQLPTGQDLTQVQVITQVVVGGVAREHYITTAPRKVFSNTTDITVFGQSLRIYADKNTNVNFLMTRNPAAGVSTVGAVTISGYFVPQP
jgi:hypothetical protein